LKSEKEGGDVNIQGVVEKWVIVKPEQARVTLIINQQMHYIKFHIKTLKIAPTCFDPKIILRELRCSLPKSF